ncbi:MAG: HAMP domain-containing sensor histidine kinase, partial [Rhizobiaceae bacterium]
MSTYRIDDVDRLQRINEALVNRVERAMDQSRNAFSLFQTAISLEGQVRRRTDELTATLRTLERSNAELGQQKEISEKANALKTRFLAAASHDVLQPLHAAQLTVSALADLQTTDKGRELVAQVERSLDMMNDLLRTLLDISRLDAGAVVPDFATVTLSPLVSSLIADFRPPAAARGLRLLTRIRPLAVRSDRTMLIRILQNLIANAVRYTETGGVLVAVRERGGRVVIDVIDSGVGIAEAELANVFEEFHRGDRAGMSDDGGLGLGLAIVRRLVAALGHRLDLS